MINGVNIIGDLLQTAGYTLGGSAVDFTVHKLTEPDKPTRAVTLFDDFGDKLSRDPRTGVVETAPRVSFRVRSDSRVEAERHLEALLVLIDQTWQNVNALSDTVRVLNVQRDTDFMAIGRDEHGQFIWALNVRIVYQAL